MKVIHLTSGGDVGGAKTHIISLVDRLSSDIDVCLIPFREGKFSEEAITSGIRTKICKGGLFGSVFRVKREIKQQGCDILHCHGAKANVAGALLKVMGCKARIVTTMHSDYKKDYLGIPLKQYTFGVVNSIALRFLDEYIVVSDYMAEIMIGRGFDPNKILHIFNGIDFDERGHRVDKSTYFKKLGVTCHEEDIVIGIAARLTAVKDIKTLIAGFAVAAKSVPHIRLVIAGDGEERDMLESLASSLCIEDRVHFLGWISQMKDFYSAIDINTLTSLSEGFPYALLEGINARCASISSDVKSARLIIEDKKDGFIFPIGDSEALGACIVRLAGDSALRGEFSEELFKKCSEKFSLDKMKQEQIKIYERLIKRAQLTGRRGVCICGAYGRGNAGDDALLDAILQEMRSIDEDMPIWVLSKNPKGTRLSNRVDATYTFNVFGFISRLARARLFISGGGNLIQDDTSSRSLYFYLFTIMMGKLFGNKVMMYGCGVGPVTKPINMKMTARCLDRYVDHITLREEESCAILKAMGVSKPEVSMAADPALNLEPKGFDMVRTAFDAENIPFEGDYICVSVRNWPGFDEAAPLIAEAVDYACEKYALTPVFLPIELSRTRPIDNDATAVQKVISFMKTKEIYSVKNRYDASTTIGIIARMKVILSMRLHALVFAAGQGVPAIAVSYGPKVKGFMRYMGQDMCMDVKDTDVALLQRYIDEAVMKSRNNDESIRQVAKLREMEFVNVKVASKLLEYEA